MLLTPKAKPVRIRIESDGIEHSSLNSLREHFNFKDVLSLCKKGSMLRWLEQQNEQIVLNRLKVALTCAPTDTNYNLNIILSFFPDAVDSGVSDSKGLLLYWTQKKEYSKVSSVIEHITTVDELQSLLESGSDAIYTALYKKILGCAYLNSGNLQAAADFGNKEALHKLKEVLPAYTSNFSSEDIASFEELKSMANDQEGLNSKEFTSPVKNCAVLISLIQDITLRSENPENLSIYLSQDDRIRKKIWPSYLQPYISYIMCAVRKYIGTSELDRWAHRKTNQFRKEPDGKYTLRNVKLSSAEVALFDGLYDYPKNAASTIKTISLNYLQKVKTNNKESFLTAINGIRDEILGD